MTRVPRALLTLACVVAFAAAGDPCKVRLAPDALRELPPKEFVRAHSIAWVADDALLIGDGGGIARYTISTAQTMRLIGPRAVPNGLARVENLATDGRTVVAFNTAYEDVAADAASGRIRYGRKAMSFQLAAVAVRGDVVAALGYPQPPANGADPSLWLGRLGDEWQAFQSADKLAAITSPPRFTLTSVPPFAGAIAIESDGTIDVVTGWRAGIWRYRSNGTRLTVLGSALTQLVIPPIPFGDSRIENPDARYLEVANRQPTADDVIATPDGPAIVVRTADGNRVQWHLWFPAAVGLRRGERNAARIGSGRRVVEGNRGERRRAARRRRAAEASMKIVTGHTIAHALQWPETFGAYRWLSF
jgi:hypothetical protein